MIGEIRNQKRWDRAVLRRKRKKERDERRRLLKPRTAECPNCGGQMVWCSGCEMFSAVCCERYGSCMCS